MKGFISREKILQAINGREEVLYHHYFGIDVSKKKCKSIIRNNDRNSSMHFHLKDGRVKWTDFGTNYSDNDIFDLLYITQGWNFYEALIHINLDFNLGYDYSDKYKVDILISNPVNTDVIINRLQEQEKVDIQVVLNKHNNVPIFTKDDFKYWNTGYITKPILQRERVFSVSTALINGIPVMNYHKKNPIFLYLEYVNDIKYFKLYRPLNDTKDGKWLSNIQEASKAVGGLKYLQNVPYLVITKSRKDYMVLRWILGINTIYIQSESTPIDVEIMNMLWDKYSIIYSLFDNDESGYLLNEKFAEVNETIPIFYNKNEGNDSWEVVVNNGIDKSKEIINKLIS